MSPLAHELYFYALMILALASPLVFALSLTKLGREPSTHSYLARAWGLVLLGAFTAILGVGESRYSIPILFVAYLTSFVDIVAIILVLPRWQTDVPSAYHARLIRRNIPSRRHGLFH